MNKHIKLVKKWLADPTSVTQQELEDNCDAAAYAAADADVVADVVVYYVYYAAVYASAARADAAYWVKRYEELTEQGE
jgi:hypothetical protein